MDSFATSRLTVAHWRDTLASRSERLTLEAELAGILTDQVLAPLPEPLQLSQSAQAVSEWIDARAGESDVYLVRETQSGTLAGLMILAGEGDTLHLGYLLAEAVWGRGYATELVTGLVEALKTEAPLRILAGVARDNPASARVLEKAGFHSADDQPDPETLLFALRLS